MPTILVHYHEIALKRGNWPVFLRHLPETLRRAKAMGLRVLSLPSWFDIDTPRDLERLRASLAETPGAGPRHTRQFLTECA